MADNVTIPATGSGDATPVIATDDVGGVHYQKVKIDVGAGGASAELGNSNPLPISDAGGNISIDDGGNTITVDGTVAVTHAALTELAAAIDTEMQVDVVGALPAGTNNIGDVDILSIAAGNNNIGDVDVASIAAGDNNIGNVDVVTLPALPAGNNNIGDVDVASIVPGTGATNLGKAEDAAHTSGDVGVMMLAVRQDSHSDLAADGDYIPPTIDADGGLRVSIVAGAGSGGTSAADDADFTDGTTSGTPAMGVYESTPSTVTDGDLGVVGITEDRQLKVSVGNTVTVASHAVTNAGTFATQIDGNALTALQLIDDPVFADDAAYTAATSKLMVVGGQYQSTPNALDDNDAGSILLDANHAVQAVLRAGTAAFGKLAANSGVDIGDVDITSIAAGDNNIGNVDIASIAAGDNNIGNVDIVSLPALAAGTAEIGSLLPPDTDVTAHTNYAKKYYTNSGAVTDGIVWSPAAGKRYHVVSMFINTSAAATVTFEDDKAGGDEAIMKMELAANSGFTINFGEQYPLASGEDAADLLVTTSAGNIYITCTGYEI